MIDEPPYTPPPASHAAPFRSGPRTAPVPPRPDGPRPDGEDAG
ncbi:hypothetical protein OHR68_03615 [Spirillospora sp. NBC_00431]